ncbi:TetR/AcrR family transcriptional regulator [Microbacterium sp. CPCC 204701]|uniref:TetR/AcrR family transcriptional regulator n=1 Tax=Microbacterium sp. CPCC 204701 TaxID=2493084 RepID=UPI000FDB59BD|nr:TetR/AcrR family transcriptional regulator [Microbacterium sp. CPCC 204701]
MYEIVPVEAMSPVQLRKRKLILDAVIKLVDRDGVDAVGVKSVSTESGIALATIYRFFSSKEHLFASAITYWGEPLAARTPDPDPEQSLDEQLVATVRRGTHAYLRHPNLLAMMVQSSVSSDPYVSEIMAELRRTTRLALVRSMPGYPEADAFALSELVQSLWWDLLTQWFVGRRSMADGLDLARRQIRWAVQGLDADR